MLGALRQVYPDPLVELRDSASSEDQNAPGLAIHLTVGLVNGARIEGRHLLRVGDELGLQGIFEYAD